jgi:hypothetical protein
MRAFRVTWLVVMLGWILAAVTSAQQPAGSAADRPWLKPLVERMASDMERAAPNLAQKRMAVAPIEADAQSLLRDELIAALATRTTMLERDKVDLIFTEQKIQASAAIDQRTAVTLGRLVGADTILYGKVRQWEERPGYLRFDAVLTLVDVQHGEILWSKSYQENPPVSKGVWAIGGLALLILLVVAGAVAVALRKSRRPALLQEAALDTQDDAEAVALSALGRLRALTPRLEAIPGAKDETKRLKEALQGAKDALSLSPAGDAARQGEGRMSKALEARREALRSLKVALAELEDLSRQHEDGFGREAAATLRRIEAKVSEAASLLRSASRTVR